MALISGLGRGQRCSTTNSCLNAPPDTLCLGTQWPQADPPTQWELMRGDSSTGSTPALGYWRDDSWFGQGLGPRNFKSLYFDCDYWCRNFRLLGVAFKKKCLFSFERETECKWGRGRERRRHRIWSRLQAPSCQHRARRGAPTHKPWDGDLSRSWTLNWLSSPGSLVWHFWTTI